MSRPVKSPTADCLYCGTPVRRTSAGAWRTRKHGDQRPERCDVSPDKRHAPSPLPEMTEGQRILEESLLDSSQATP